MKTNKTHELDHWTVIELIKQHEAHDAQDPTMQISALTVDPTHWTIEECNDWLATFNPHEKPLTHYGDEIMRRVVRMRALRPIGKTLFPVVFLVDPKTFGKHGANESGTSLSREYLLVDDVHDIYKQLGIAVPQRGVLADNFAAILNRPLPLHFDRWPQGLRGVLQYARDARQKRKRVMMTDDPAKATILAKAPHLYNEDSEDDEDTPSAKFTLVEESFLKFVRIVMGVNIRHYSIIKELSDAELIKTARGEEIGPWRHFYDDMRELFMGYKHGWQSGCDNTRRECQ
jgi:hypothetical protein